MDAPDGNPRRANVDERRVGCAGGETDAEQGGGGGGGRVEAWLLGWWKGFFPALEIDFPGSVLGLCGAAIVGQVLAWAP